ncbi:MAG TPA: aspartate kinase [Methanolinea sp.]|nr:aspartate kinase [Methanolinea sp.]HOS81895.1 aspartate kinase [Methanolinea sp.]HPC55430.1 aspartate kinase [Methanolinea sp.]HQE85514.1 aspartate kinase [Methanolinea sp.]HQI14367.1 aspartate kinase [Methanolinea sp.]
MKFGGTSVADGGSVSRVVDIVESCYRAGNEVAVVVSAQRGVTDQLIAIASELANNHNSDEIGRFINSLRVRHGKVLLETAEDYADEVGILLEEQLCNLENILTAVHNLRELTPRSRDYIITFGERLNSLVVSAALKQRGIPSMILDGCEAGIVTTASHGEAVAIPASEGKIKSRVLPLLTNTVPVIMGFMGCTEKGVVTTLGRSGSDYSAALIGAAIDADEIVIWTDVDGIMTSDPRIINDARVIPVISYHEVMELSYFGAKVMHPRSIEPAMKKDILVRVKNTFNPDHPGTAIVRGQKRDSRVVKALTYIEKVALVNICGAQMIGRPGVAKAIFTLLADRDINVMMISQGSSEANISLVIDESQEDAAKEALSVLVAEGRVREVTTNSDVCAVAVVGAGMAGARGTGGRIFSALGNGGVNVMMISQGSSELNISFVVTKADGPKAVRILHDEFRLSEEDNG